MAASQGQALNLAAAGPPRPVDTLLRPFREFARLQAASGVLLLLCTVIALVWANSPWSPSYVRLWGTTVTVGAGSFVIAKPLLLWINDGLMAVFFFVVGLEIKREMLAGELASFRRAALPLAAAVGGMILPAGIYAVLNAGAPAAAARGWGVPMATDIAFALGVLALLGTRAPVALKIFLTAFAIVDDIGAVLVIALFYTEKIAGGALLAGFGLLALAALANRIGVRRPLVYTVIGVAVWVAFLKSGVHATVAGVLLALAVPAGAHLNPRAFVAGGRALLDRFENAAPGDDDAAAGERQAVLHTLEHACERVQTPLGRMEHTLHPWVTFAIMPVFALANAGVALTSGGGNGEVGSGNGLGGSVALGVIFGLLIGKPLGVTLFSYLAVRTGLAALPAGVTWRHIFGAGWLGGIGFTMSLFITSLAFADTPLAATAKIAILSASFVAGVIGFLLLRAAPPGKAAQGAD